MFIFFRCRSDLRWYQAPVSENPKTILNQFSFYPQSHIFIKIWPRLTHYIWLACSFLYLHKLLVNLICFMHLNLAFISKQRKCSISSQINNTALFHLLFSKVLNALLALFLHKILQMQKQKITSISSHNNLHLLLYFLP